MKRNVLVLFFVFFIIISCDRKISPQEIVRNENSLILESKTKEIVVSIPYKMTINERILFSIRDNGIVEIDDNVYVYSEYSNGTVRENDVLFRLYDKNNLFGINILEQFFDGGVLGYTLLYNAETKELFMNQRDHINDLGQDTIFWDFFSIGNHFIVAFGAKAYAYNDFTGELLWTQVYYQKDGTRIIIYDDSFVINDKDGNKYRIYGDGRKEKFE